MRFRQAGPHMSEPRNQLNRLCFMPDARPRASGKFPRASARALTFIALLICAKAQASATTQPEPDYVEDRKSVV
jgi:hypothetical protein